MPSDNARLGSAARRVANTDNVVRRLNEASLEGGIGALRKTNVFESFFVGPNDPHPSSVSVPRLLEACPAVHWSDNVTFCWPPTVSADEALRWIGFTEGKDAVLRIEAFLHAARHFIVTDPDPTWLKHGIRLCLVPESFDLLSEGIRLPLWTYAPTPGGGPDSGADEEAPRPDVLTIVAHTCAHAELAISAAILGDGIPQTIACRLPVFALGFRAIIADEIVRRHGVMVPRALGPDGDAVGDEPANNGNQPAGDDSNNEPRTMRRYSSASTIMVSAHDLDDIMQRTDQREFDLQTFFVDISDDISSADQLGLFGFLVHKLGIQRVVSFLRQTLLPPAKEGSVAAQHKMVMTRLNEASMQIFQMPLDPLLKEWTDVMLSVTEVDPLDKRYRARLAGIIAEDPLTFNECVAWLARYSIKNMRDRTIWCAAVILFLTAVEIIKPLLIREIFSSLVPEKNYEELVAAVIMLAVLFAGGIWLRFTLHVKIPSGNVFNTDMRLRLATHMAKCPQIFHDNIDRYKVMAILQNDVPVVSDGVQATFFGTFAILQLITGVALLFFLSWEMTWAVVILLPIMWFFTLAHGHTVAMISLRFRDDEKQYLSELEESLALNSLKRLLGLTTTVDEFLKERAGLVRTIAVELKVAEAVNYRGVEIISVCMLLLVIGVGAFLMASGRLGIGAFLAYYVAATRIGPVLASLSISLRAFHRCRAALASILGVFDIPVQAAGSHPLPPPPPMAKRKPYDPGHADSMGLLGAPLIRGGGVADVAGLSHPSSEDGSSDIVSIPSIGDVAGRHSVFEPLIAVDTVGFSYPVTGANFNIEDLTLRIPFGEKIGIVGLSGSGKTTLFKLLSGLYRPTKGKVLLRGCPVHRLAANVIVAMEHEPMLFNRTIRDNIAMGTGATDKQIEDACRLAAFDRDLDTMVKGLDTLVGHNGGRLSGGQRQRLCIARILLRNSPVVMLDEPVSGQDLPTAATIADAVRGLKWNPKTLMDPSMPAGDSTEDTTVVCVSQQLQFLRGFNKIIVVDAGRVVEYGDPKNLLARRGFYWRLVNQQTGFSVEPSGRVTIQPWRLRAVWLFASLPESSLSVLADLFSSRKCSDAAEAIGLEGSVGDSLFFVANGVVQELHQPEKQDRIDGADPDADLLAPEADDDSDGGGSEADGGAAAANAGAEAADDGDGKDGGKPSKKGESPDLVATLKYNIGDVFGEEALVGTPTGDPYLWGATFRASPNCLLLSMQKYRFDRAVESSPGIGDAVARMAAARDEALSRLGLAWPFVGLDSDAVQKLRKYCRTIVAEAGTRLFNEPSEPCNALHIVVYGKVHVKYNHGALGNPRERQDFFHGMWFGESSVVGCDRWDMGREWIQSQSPAARAAAEDGAAIPVGKGAGDMLAPWAPITAEAVQTSVLVMLDASGLSRFMRQHPETVSIIHGNAQRWRTLHTPEGLSRCWMLSLLPRPCLLALAASLTVRVLPEGGTVVDERSNGPGRSLFFVLNGEITLSTQPASSTMGTFGNDSLPEISPGSTQPAPTVTPRDGAPGSSNAAEVAIDIAGQSQDVAESVRLRYILTDDFFGEGCLLTPGPMVEQGRVAFAESQTLTSVLALDRHAFLEGTDPYHEIIGTLRRIRASRNHLLTPAGLRSLPSGCLEVWQLKEVPQLMETSTHTPGQLVLDPDDLSRRILMVVHGSVRTWNVSSDDAKKSGAGRKIQLSLPGNNKVDDKDDGGWTGVGPGGRPVSSNSRARTTSKVQGRTAVGTSDKTKVYTEGDVLWGINAGATERGWDFAKTEASPTVLMQLDLSFFDPNAVSGRNKYNRKLREQHEKRKAIMARMTEIRQDVQQLSVQLGLADTVFDRVTAFAGPWSQRRDLPLSAQFRGAVLFRFAAQLVITLNRFARWTESRVGGGTGGPQASSGSLGQELSRLRRQRTQLVTERTKREGMAAPLERRLRRLWDRLDNVTDEQIAFLVDRGDLSLRRIDILLGRVKSARHEIAARRTTLRGWKKECVEIRTQLQVLSMAMPLPMRVVPPKAVETDDYEDDDIDPPEEEDESAVQNHEGGYLGGLGEDTDARTRHVHEQVRARERQHQQVDGIDHLVVDVHSVAMEDAREEVDTLRDLRSERLSKMSELRVICHPLWERLKVPYDYRAAFVGNNLHPSATSLRNYEKEVMRLRELLNEPMAAAQISLMGLWESLEVPFSDRSQFYGDLCGPDEKVLARLEQEVRLYERLSERLQHILGSKDTSLRGAMVDSMKRKVSELERQLGVRANGRKTDSSSLGAQYVQLLQVKFERQARAGELLKKLDKIWALLDTPASEREETRARYANSFASGSVPALRKEVSERRKDLKEPLARARASLEGIWAELGVAEEDRVPFRERPGEVVDEELVEAHLQELQRLQRLQQLFKASADMFGAGRKGHGRFDDSEDDFDDLDTTLPSSGPTMEESDLPKTLPELRLLVQDTQGKVRQRERQLKEVPDSVKPHMGALDGKTRTELVDSYRALRAGLVQMESDATRRKEELRQSTRQCMALYKKLGVPREERQWVIDARRSGDLSKANVGRVTAEAQRLQQKLLWKNAVARSGIIGLWSQLGVPPSERATFEEREESLASDGGGLAMYDLYQDELQRLTAIARARERAKALEAKRRKAEARRREVSKAKQEKEAEADEEELRRIGERLGRLALKYMEKRHLRILDLYYHMDPDHRGRSTPKKIAQGTFRRFGDEGVSLEEIRALLKKKLRTNEDGLSSYPDFKDFLEEILPKD